MSSTNASTSSGVGGRPIRSNDSRRISVRRSAGGRGRKPGLLQPCRMKSIDRIDRPLRHRAPAAARRSQRLQRPPVVAGAAVAGVEERIDRIGGPFRAGGDPLAQQRPLVGRSAAAALRAASRPPRRAARSRLSSGFAGHRAPAAVAAGQGLLAARQVQPPLRSDALWHSRQLRASSTAASASSEAAGIAPLGGTAPTIANKQQDYFKCD